MKDIVSKIPLINLPDTSPTTDTEPIKAVVFTIQEELFEKQFRSRTPIDRRVLLQYLQKLVEVYNIHTLRKFKVLAIDYDLSPNNYILSDENDECIIANGEERAAQKELDEFLASLDKEQGVKVILSKHIPVKSKDLCRCKLRWEQEKSHQGILFGHPTLVHSGLLGPVLHYAEYTGDKESFSAVALDAEHGKESCDDVEQLSPKDLRHASLHTINYVQVYVKGDVKVCQLKDEKGFDDCQKFFQERIEEVSIIFFGGDYGKGDMHLTPLGVKPGVTVQAYTYLSMRQRLQPEDGCARWFARWGAWIAWIGDILLGSLVGLGFHKCWYNFHKASRFTPQIGWASANFGLLIFVLILLMVIAAKLLECGAWINPVLIVAGLFIDSYITAAATTGGGEAHSGSHRDHPTSIDRREILLRGLKRETQRSEPLYRLFGIPSPSTSVSKPLSRHDLFVYGTIKIALFWIVVGMAVYRLGTHH